MSAGITESGDVLNSQPESSSESVAVSTNSLKAKVFYIQTQPKVAKSNMVNTVQFTTLPSTKNSNQGVILTPMMKKQLVLRKSNNMKTVTLSSGSKLSGTYVTMLKPLAKLNDESKLMIAPMPKVIKNRLPVTMTTNSLRQKIAFMPLVSSTAETNSKMFKLKISDGQVTDVPQDEPPKSDTEYELSILDDVSKRREIKFAKHGISILKKHYQSDKSKLNNSTAVLDCEQVVRALQKGERRRKASFCYRKDYDDVEGVKVVDGGDKAEYAEEKKTDINMNDDFDLRKVLRWDEGVGSLPGSELKFIVNEFNLIEYVPKEDCDRILEKRLSKINKHKNEFQEELCCLECGCYGLPSEFISQKHCSLACQDSGSAKHLKDKETIKFKKRKKKSQHTQQLSPLKRLDSDPLSGISDEDNNTTSNENSQDKFSYPWNCSKKGFSWTKYLDHIKAKAAPVKLFKEAFPYNRNGFRVGMKMEGVDPQHPSYFCVLTVTEVSGYRIRLHFDGYPENYDFWVNADSMDIFPVGWCEKHNHVLQAPPGYTSENFNWLMYLKLTKAPAAPKHLFANRAGSAICPNGFRVGMKLEAVDKKNTSLVCVATVRDMMDNRILVHFDSWDDIYDYWADPTSPYIHPVGWCDQCGHNLTPPNDYPNPETFSWAVYLKDTKTVAAPVRAFKQRPNCGFKRGMRLECVDKRVPQLIRAATVDDVKDHRIRIQFDGWPDRYSYWMQDDSEDIHPVGWCQKTGHPIETPLTPDDVYDFLECPTVGCRGLGHMHGAKFATHSDQKYCPYAEDNIDVEKVLPDRLLSPDRTIGEAVPISREPKEKLKPRMGRPPKYLKLNLPKEEPLSDDNEPKPEEYEDNEADEDEIEEELQEEPTQATPSPPPPPPEIKPKRKYRKRLKPVLSDCGSEPKRLKVASPLIEQIPIEPVVFETWSRHSRFLESYVRNVGDVTMWQPNRVANFLQSIVPELDLGGHVIEKDIDGEALLLLNQADLIDAFRIKVGPAIKVYNIIVMLRQKSGRLWS